MDVESCVSRLMKVNGGWNLEYNRWRKLDEDVTDMGDEDDG